MMPGLAGSLRIELLGAVRAWRGEQELKVGGPKQQAVLGVLAARANRVVSRSELIDAVWGQAVPRSGASALYSYVKALRYVIEPTRAHRARTGDLSSMGQGYLLRLEPGQLDVELFDQHLAHARGFREAGELVKAVSCFDDALRLWRGMPWAQVPGPFADVERERLTGQYVTAAEDRAELMLVTGQHEASVDELIRLAAEHPFRERLAGLLMIALYRGGRQAESLTVYSRMQQLLADELGVEPEPDLQRLHIDILNNRDAQVGGQVTSRIPALTGMVMAPRQLPPAAPHFTGRSRELQLLSDLIQESAGPVGTVVISVICGMPGVGKTALAVHWAYQVADQFPDGQLYVDLRGFDPHEPPLTPSAALERLLNGLGVNSQHLPSGLDEQTARYRTLLASKKALIVLDNAVSAEQVRPLLPGGWHNLVLVTSRNSLSGLVARDGAHPINLDVLGAEESAQLLSSTIGADRVAAEPGAATELAELCGHLPLALRVAGARAAAGRHKTLADFAAEMAVEHKRLDTLAADEVFAVRAAFSWSYRSLPAKAAAAFRLLGLYPGADIDRTAAMALTAQAPIDPILEVLAGAHLLQQTGRSRYRMHDVLRLYAAERANAEEGEADRQAAVKRLLTWYLHTADAADQMLIPNRRRVPLGNSPEPAVSAFPTYHSALAWCDAERSNLAALTRQAARLGDHETAWKLPVALWGYFMVRKPWSEWETTNQIGLSAARHLGNISGEAHILGSLAFIYMDRRRPAEAMQCMRTALALCRTTGDQWGEAVALLGLGMAYRQQHDLSAAIPSCQEALAIWRRIDDDWGAAHTLSNLGDMYRILRCHAQAIDCLHEALEIFGRVKDRWGQARTLANLGSNLGDMRRHGEAIYHLTRALRIRREIADRRGQAETLDRLAAVLEQTGACCQARATWRQALTIFEELGDPQADLVRTRVVPGT